MIERWIITGDLHGDFNRLKDIPNEENIGFIVLGDAGFNFWLNGSDDHWKKKITKLYKFTIYCVRGNHEARPQSIPGMECVFDENVSGPIYYQPQYPHIRYFEDYGIYDIGDYKCLVIGGAYSVDKWYRLSQVGLTPNNNDPRISHWWNDEQLTDEEKKGCEQLLQFYPDIDVVLSHTCPISYEPTDLFLDMVDQTRVDKSMEIWLDKLGMTFNWKVWLFGHYHADRIETVGVEQFFKDIETLDSIMKRQEEIQEQDAFYWYRVPRSEL